MSKILFSGTDILHVNRNNIVSLQILRWRRKPRWEPTAKSKLIIPERKKQLQNEKIELLSLHNKYRTQINSLRSYIHQEIKTQIASSSYKNSAGDAREQYLDQKCVEKNMAWNESISLRRKERIIEQNRGKIEYVNKRLKLAELREENNRNYDFEVMDIQKKSAQNFISEGELYDAIVDALENSKEDLFSIDLKGGVYKD